MGSSNYWLRWTCLIAGRSIQYQTQSPWFIILQRLSEPPFIGRIIFNNCGVESLTYLPRRHMVGKEVMDLHKAKHLFMVHFYWTSYSETHGCALWAASQTTWLDFSAEHGSSPKHHPLKAASSVPWPESGSWCSPSTHCISSLPTFLEFIFWRLHTPEFPSLNFAPLNINHSEGLQALPSPWNPF